MTASPASSHTQDEQRAQKHKSTPRQQLARANQKSNHNVLKGYLMTYTIGLRQTQRPVVRSTNKKTPITLKSCKGQQHYRRKLYGRSDLKSQENQDNLQFSIQYQVFKN